MPVEADVAHPGGGHHPEHAVHQPQARPEDGHHGELCLALEISNRRSVFMNGKVHVMDHPLVAHKLTILRDKNTS